MNKLRFHPDWEIFACESGVFEVPSGTAPHDPDEVYALRRNATYQYEPSDSELERIKAAARVDYRALVDALDTVFTPVGRANEGCWL